MAPIFHFDNNTFRHFVKDNFKLIKSYLSEGIFDRRNFFETTDWKGFPASSFSSSLLEMVEVGDILFDFGKPYMCLPKNNIRPPHITCKERYGTEGCWHITPIISEDNTNVVYYKDSNSEVVKGKKEIKESNEGRAGKDKFYFPICWLHFNPEDREIWDSFFTFFEIAATVGHNNPDFISAPADLQEAARITSGLPSDSLRFLVGLGDQYLKYIFLAFNIESQVPKLYRKYKERKRDKVEDTILVTQYSRLCALKEYIYRINALPQKYDCLKVVQLLDLNRRIRNTESHQQMKWDNPVEMIRQFILDHVILVYMLKHVLKIGVSEEYQSGVVKRNLFIPVRVSSNISVIGSNDVVVEGENGVSYVKLFSKFEAGGVVHNIENLEVTEVKIRKELDTVLVTTDLLARIENLDYNPVIESIQAQLAILRSESVTERQIQKVTEEINIRMRDFFLNHHKELDSKIANQERRISGMETDSLEYLKAIEELKILVNTRQKENDVLIKLQKKIKRASRSTMVLWILISVGLLTIALPLVMANIRDWAVKNDFCYFLSQTDLNFSHDHGDISYDRGKYLDKKIANLLGDFNMAFCDSIFESQNPLREKASEAYRNAMKAYMDILSHASSPDSDSGHAAYRLSLMCMNGQGKALGLKKAAEYASQINSENGRGLKALLEYWSTDDHRMLRKDIPLLRKAPADDYFAPLAIAEYELACKSDSISLYPEIESKLLEACRNIMSLNNDASPIAGLALVELLYSGKMISHKFPYVALGILTELSDDNIPVAQTLLGDILCKLNFPELAIPQLLAAFCNGNENAGLEAIHYIEKLGVDKDEIFSQYPVLNRLNGRTNVFKEIESIPRSIIGLPEEDKSAAIDRIRYLKDHMPVSLGLISADNLNEMMTLSDPDSAAYVINHIDSFPLHPTLENMAKDIRGAVKDYVLSMYYSEGLGHLNKNKQLADSLLVMASSKGLPYAFQTRAIKIFRGDADQQRVAEAISLMEEAAPHSDDAKLWLAERYRFIDKDKSRLWAMSITDSLNLYRIMRQMDDINFKITIAQNKEEMKSLFEVGSRLYGSLNASLDITRDAVLRPRLLATAIAYLAMCLPDTTRDQFVFYQILASRLRAQEELLLLSFRSSPTKHLNLPLYWKQLKTSGMDNHISPWMRENIEFELNGIFLPMAYPTIARDDFSSEIPEYVSLSKLIVL